MVANGDGPRDHPAIKALNLPPLGQAVRSSAIATKTLLFVTEGDQINPRTPPGGGGRKFRALDKATGKTAVGDRARGRRQRRADDVSVQRQAVRRAGDRRSSTPANSSR